MRNPTRRSGHAPRATSVVVQAYQTGDAHGELLAWARVYDGHWIALVRVVVKAGQGQLPMIQRVPAATVRPTEPPTGT